MIDKNIGPIVFGTSCLGNLYQELPWATKLALVKEYFHSTAAPTVDTAGKYGAGMALTCLGRALRELNILPEQIIISNKLGWRRQPLCGKEPTFEPGVWKNIGFDAMLDISYDGILRCYREGRELLGEGYGFDLLSVHDPDEFLKSGGKKDDILGAYRALFELKNQGETAGIGIGAKDWTVIRDLYYCVKFDWVMFACAPTVLSHPPELLKFIRQLADDGVFIINSAVFNGGFLTGGDYLDYRLANPVRDAEMFQTRAKFLACCQKYQISPAAAAVEFGMRIPGVRATALNTSNPARIAENVGLVTHHSPAAFWAELQSLGVIPC